MPKTTGRSAFGEASVMRTSFGPVAMTSVIWSASDFALELTAGSLWRSNEKTTSAEVRGLPSWKRTSLSLTVHTVALSFSIELGEVEAAGSDARQGR